MATETHSFLGANTPNGFVSLFGELYDPYRDHNVHIIKGGPGCGKTSLAKGLLEFSDYRGITATAAWRPTSAACLSSPW